MVFTHSSLRTLMKHSPNEVLQTNILINWELKQLKAAEMLLLRMNSVRTLFVDFFRHIYTHTHLQFLIFICPCVANIFAAYNQQDATFHNLFISIRRSTCFRRFFRPSSGAQNCVYNVRYLSDRYCYLLLA